MPRVFVLSITEEGCQESGEIKVNNSDKCVLYLYTPADSTLGKRLGPLLTLHNNNTNTQSNTRIVIIPAENERGP